jgi:Flp pilus assembly protein TadD
VRCPGAQERAYWVSPRPGQSIIVRAEAANDGPALLPLEAGKAKIELRRLVQQAVQKRAAGQFDEAIKDLHEAAKMDAENSDLHRELGITFLLERDWKRARVEMLEALKHDPTDADAHNGLGYALDKMGDTQAALDEFRTATHLDPDDPSYRQHYLEALAKLTAEQGAKKK